MAEAEGQAETKSGFESLVEKGRRFLESLGEGTMRAVSEVGFGAWLLIRVVFFIFLGPSRAQPVRIPATFERAMEVGIKALPIVTLMSITVGMMLAIQGIYSLRIFGAEDQVTIGMAFSVSREFAPLITGVIVAGRTGSSLAARIGTMRISQELDALEVMGIEAVRFLVAPALIAMVVMVPLLALWADVVMLLGAGIYIWAELGLTMGAYVHQLRDLLRPEDVMHGFWKSILFGILITLVGVINGAGVTGGAEGVGRMTTRSVVLAISAIIVTDMIFGFITTR